MRAKQCKECTKCPYFRANAYEDMGAKNAGCKLLEYHKDYGIWGSLFDEYTDEKCKYFEPKEKLKDKIKRILGDDFKENDEDGDFIDEDD